ncbi:putative GTPase activating protein for Arf [Trypanosoma vivax]|nr:putative GTPase activating protein for Arf [Trypanosoma vivax]
MADHELSQKNRIGALLKRPENKSCFECLENQPRWASTNLGVFLCLRCAGLHRSLGTHVSKVRSTTMDKWEEHMIRCCECVGNARGRQLYEHNMPESARPGVGGNEISIERFIRSKYEQRAYFHPDCERLLQSLLSGNGAELANSTAGNQPLRPMRVPSPRRRCQTSGATPLRPPSQTTAAPLTVQPSRTTV